MAKITTVDYLAMPKNADAIHKHARDLNKEMTQAYKTMADMHENWYGKRYNELAKSFNNLKPNITEMLDLVGGVIPFTLKTIANNYSKADTGSIVGSAVKEAMSKITDVMVHGNDVGMRFMTNEVKSAKNSISRNFKNAKDIMNKIEAEYNKITWKSEAAEAFRNKFLSLKKSITKSFDEIEIQFTKLMQQTLDDMQTTETKNTVQ